MEKMKYEVCYSLNGYVTVDAKDQEEAMNQAEKMVKEKIKEAEKVVGSNLQIDVYDCWEAE